jgi:hypothetical protein
MPLEPFHIAALGMSLDLPEQFNRLRLKAGIGRVRIGNDRFNIHRDDVPIRAHQPCSPDSFQEDSCYRLIKKMDRDQLGHINGS